MTEQLRKEFEAWMASQRNGLLKYSTMYSTARRGKGYVDSITDMLWESWQAARRTEPERKVEPVSAQVRYRRPEKGLPNWSDWQPAKVDETKPTYHFDEQGWEVEYRLLYTAPQPADFPLDLPLFARRMDEELGKHDIQGFEPVVLAVAEEVMGYEHQPAPDVAELVEALQTACDYLPIGSRALELASIALAAHRKGAKI